MEIETILPTLAVAYLALVLWLAVRIMNRRERWTKWTAASVIGGPVLYVLSFGPACWIASRTERQILPRAYLPVLYAMFAFGDEKVLNLTCWYAGIGMPSTGAVNFPLLDDGDPEGYVICNSPSEVGKLDLYCVEGRWSMMSLLEKLGGRKYRTVPAPAASSSRASN